MYHYQKLHLSKRWIVENKVISGPLNQLNISPLWHLLLIITTSISNQQCLRSPFSKKVKAKPWLFYSKEKCWKLTGISRFHTINTEYDNFNPFLVTY